MAKCSLCGKEDLAFTCPYCRMVYCAEHRLPESHGCPAMQDARDAAKKKISARYSGKKQENEKTKSGFSILRNRPQSRRRKIANRFSQREIRDLLISSILVILVGISLHSAYSAGFGIIAGILTVSSLIAGGYWWVPVGTIVIFLTSFMVHEMAHKFVAQKYGMWSEFRMTQSGYLLSALAILLSVPIFGTGVVFTSGSRSLEQEGKVNASGPTSNLILASIALSVILLGQWLLGGVVYQWFFVLKYTIILNAMLGLFNMIPFQPFDGGTVMAWNKKFWAVITVALVALYILGNLL
ncbi:hypothetical protein EU537_08400 [Candidatus Thorarchaeota archaeon]|nr:MAG: hypothetical protein EU537_08400 [Candidatus Thorarchaeota archaeon]